MNHRMLALLLSGTLLLGSCKSKKEAPATTSENNPTSSAPAETASNPTPPEQPPQEQPAPPKESAPAPRAHKATPKPVPQVAAKPLPPQPVVIPPGTPVAVRLVQAVSSKSSHVGDRFEASVADPIVVHGQAVVPRGAVAGGTVTEAKAAGKFKGAASLDLTLDTLIVNGTRYQIQTAPLSQTSKGKGKRSATMVGGGAGAGALIGGLAGGGKGAAIGALVGGGAGTAGAAMTGNNNDITLPAEAAVSFQLSAPVTLKPAAAPPGTQAQE